MLLTILGSILIGIGSVAVASLIIKLAAITLHWFKNIIKNRLEKKDVKETVVIDKSTLQGAIQTMLDDATTFDINAIEEWKAEEGVILADIDSDRNIISDSIEIYTSDKMDNTIKYNLQKCNGVMKVANRV